MRFDDGDFEDYQDGGLDDDRAFDDLTKLVPSATKDQASDALEEFDYDVEAAAAHLKATLKPAPASKYKRSRGKTKQKDIARIPSLSLKPTLKLVVLGHIDAGKSTLTGRLLIDAGAVPKSVLDKYQREGDKISKGSFALAWVMDAAKQERSRGVTVDVDDDVVLASFETDNKKFIIVDTPGHRDHVFNRLTCLSHYDTDIGFYDLGQADAALIVIDANVNAFEAGFLTAGQTKEHAILLRSLGIDHVVVAVNKLDKNWDEDQFEEIKIQVTELLSDIVGFNLSNIHFVPTSGANGDYVVKSSTAAPWYKGPTLVEALESIEVSHGELDAPFRLASTVAFEDLSGCLEVEGFSVSGVVEARDPIVNSNQPDITGTVVGAGDDIIPGLMCGVGIRLDNGNDYARCRPGDLFVAPEGIIPAVTSFKANVIFFDLKRPVLLGSKLSFYMCSVNRLVTVTKIIESFDKKRGKTQRNPRHITPGQGAKIQLTLDQSVPLAPISKINNIGRFVLRLDGNTIGAGIVQETMW